MAVSASMGACTMQYMFLVEAAGTVAIGLVTPFDWPRQRGRDGSLSKRQKLYAENQMVGDSATSHPKSEKRVDEGGCVRWRFLD